MWRPPLTSSLGEWLTLNRLKLFAAAAKRAARSIGRRIVDRGREWLTGQLIALLLGAVGSGALAIAGLPIFVGVACALVTIAAVISAIYARRLMTPSDATAAGPISRASASNRRSCGRRPR